MIIVTIACYIHVSNNCFLLSTENWPIFILQEKFTIQFKTTEKMIGHRSCFRENDKYWYLPLWRGPAIKKTLPFSNVRANHV